MSKGVLEGLVAAFLGSVYDIAANPTDVVEGIAVAEIEGAAIRAVTPIFN